MKKTNYIYWIITSLFSAFMTFTAIPDILVLPDVVTFMTHIGYPVYFIPFIGVAKLLGSVAILIPGFPRIKEWAYAGFAFDLIGAIYSVTAVEGFSSSTLFMILPFTFLILSYSFYHKRNKMMHKAAVA
ncbi:MAG: DoxX family protein [Bacteroidia bacterium]